ncbi:LysR family transcriptional regulator [Phaeobacter sp. QD34_3]|uniref:LysR family transcriptional regulator n=1 Tax=unclassified Phaeobacter TaxID=2621772 RepID=UPI00237F0235|nr:MULTISPECIES: LysR family transcriptional regulator [unclassified Phaeobacter]MDE4132961.1 LysR family transcriptional regulator [Phaeobacter sp. QD34_3]MDE4136637.1 LysR family transcriptional regulator [Phaeobacter sp. QD34_24]
MENWDEVRTAYQVARMGTVSGAAEVLGVHHATVIRHIDAIEARLGVKLFQRHARGYTPTESGQDLLRVAQTTDDQFSQLAGRLKGQGDEVTGELVVTSLSSLSHLLVPVLTDFQQMHPGLIIRYLTGERLFRLEYGEAHVAIRAGNGPDQPDNVVQPFLSQRVGMFATTDYVERQGLLGGVEDLHNHRFVGSDNENSRAPFYRWLREHTTPETIMFRCTDGVAMQEAVLAGAGIGFLSLWEAARHDNLVQMMEPLKEWEGSLWLVTHVDLHRTNKVQSFLKFLKERSKEWVA